jgi:hypothetical protein
MAASSDDEETNYWPGFVDALSTMTMMLIFLMMILSLVVVSISQSTSKNQIMTIARAVKVDTSGAPISIDKMTAQILEALSRQSPPVNQNLPVPESEPPRNSLLAEPSARSAVAETKNLAVDDGHKVSSRGADDALLSNGRSSSAMVDEGRDVSTQPTDNPPKSSQTAELEPQSGKYYFSAPQANPPDKRIVSRQPADVQPFGGGSDVKANKALVTIEFQPKAIRLDDDSGKKLQSFINDVKPDLGTRIVNIRAIANVINGNVTEERRFGYYRAMGLRQVLIDLGIPAEQITIGIEDVSDADKVDIVELFAS